MTEKEQASQIKESLTFDTVNDLDYDNTYFPSTESSDGIDTKIFRSIISASLVGMTLPRIYSNPRLLQSDELTIKSIVNKTLSENMPIFEKIISSMIDHKLNNLRSNPPSTINPTEIPVEFEDVIVASLSPLTFIKKISYSKYNSTIKLIVIHDESDNLKAFDMIEDAIIALEDKMPDYSIEPWILHESEVQDSFLSQTKQLY